MHTRYRFPARDVRPTIYILCGSNHDRCFAWIAICNGTSGREHPILTPKMTASEHADYKSSECSIDLLDRLGICSNVPTAVFRLSRALASPTMLSKERTKRGRPALEPGEVTYPVTVRLNSRQRSKLQMLGGASWLRQQLEKAVPAHPPLLVERVIREVAAQKIQAACSSYT